MEKTTTIRHLADRIKRHPLLQEISFETIIDYLVDFIRIVGCPRLFQEKTEKLEIKDYRAALPCDFIEMIQVRSAADHDMHKPDRPGIRRFSAYRYAGDSFFMSPDKHDVGRGGTDLTYKIQGSVIYTSTKDKPVEIAYRAIAVDAEGFPLVPDNPSFMRAFQAYVKKEWFTIMFDMGKIQSAVLQQALQDYAWTVGDCETEFHRMSLDQAESFYNSWRTLIVRDTSHKQGFVNDGVKEYLSVQP